jgi:tetratricopeptide (TPR) repeat protein
LTELLGEHHAQTLQTAGSFGADLRALGHYEKALERDRLTSWLWSEYFGDRYPLALGAANNLGVSLRAVGRFAEAHEIDEVLHQRLVGEFGPDDPRTLRTANALGRDLREVGEYRASVEWLQGVLATYAGASETNIKGSLTAQANLAASLRSAGRAGDAEPLLEDAYERLLTYFGDGNKPDTLACRLNRAVNLLVLHEADRAVAELEAITDAYADSLGEDHPLTLIARSNHAAGLRADGHHQRALSLARAALEGCRQQLGELHPYTLAAETNLAVCYDDLGDGDRAVEHMTRAAESLPGILSADHPDVLIGHISLGLIRTSSASRGRVPAVRAAFDALSDRIGRDHPAVRSLAAGTLISRLIDPSDPF